MDPDEQLIFLNKKDEQEDESPVRLTKTFNPPIRFPDEGGTISIIECSLSNTFNKINTTNNTFVLQCQGTAGAPYDPYVDYTITIPAGNYTEATISDTIHALVYAKDATNRISARNVDGAGDVVDTV